MESGCKIRIASEGNGTPERACTLTGSQESIDEAKRMLDDVVRRGMNRMNQNRDNNNAGGGYQQRRQYGNNNYQQQHYQHQNQF